MFLHRGSRLLALGTAFLLLLAMTITSVFALDINWTKNGTTNGKCNTLAFDSTVPAGQQLWLFILTSPEASGPYQLTTTFNPAWQNPANPIIGVKKANGSVHFTVYTAENATLVSAKATKGTSKSVLTVSHCTANPAPLTVTKTAATTYVRTYTWEIEKSVDVNYHDLPYLGSGTSNYTVKVTGSSADSGWAVSGGISVYNSSAFTAVVTGVYDLVSGFGAAAVSCPVTFPYNLASGGTLNCTYSSSLPDGADRLNTATATTSGVVPGSTGTANVDFGDPTTIVGYPTVTVDDTYAGALGEFSGAGGTANYSRTFYCQEDAGEHPNTATINETQQSSSASVTVKCAPPPVLYWCSPGFWSQHPEIADNYVDLNTLYSAIGGAPLKDGAPANPTIGEVLADPNVYGGEAFNSVANYISGIAFAPNGGTQDTGHNCPLNAQGEWIGG